MYVRTGSDEIERKVIADIQDCGWHCLNVLEEGAQPPFSFSIGFYKTWRFPELIAIGLSHDVMLAAFNIIADQLSAGRQIDLHATNQDLFEGYACRFVEVSKALYREYVGTALWYYEGSKFPLYQIVWPSKDGLYPWHQQASDSFRAWQPILGQAA